MVWNIKWKSISKQKKKYKEGEGANGGDATTKGIIEENFSGLKKD